MDQDLLRVLVVEDEWPARNYLVELLQGSGLAEVVGAVARVEEAREALRPAGSGLPLDAVFVDIRLAGSPHEDAGLALVRTAAAQPDSPLFVISTAFKEHALEAFDLGVVDYLLKPYTDERVEQCLRRLLARRPAPPPRAPAPLRIVARRKKSLVFLGLDEVWAFEAAERLTFVHTAAGRFDLDLSLAAIEASFGRSLLRVHRNWLVSVASVRELSREDGDVFLRLGALGAEDGIRVPVARERAQPVREALLAGSAGLGRTPGRRG